MSRKLIFFAASLALFSSSPAFAGAFVEGRGRTIEQAQENALAAARNGAGRKGCVKRHPKGVDGSFIVIKDVEGEGDNQTYVVEAYYAKNAGSCGR